MAELDIVLIGGADDGEGSRRLSWRDLPADKVAAVHDVLDATKSAVDGLVAEPGSEYDMAATWPPADLEHK